MLKAKSLKPGDTIGLVSPSGPLAGLVPHRVNQGVKALENLGYKVVIARNAHKVSNYTAGTAKERADDLHEMFSDNSVKAIISFIGGFHSNQILELLDFELIKSNPKLFIGFSDISVLHFAFFTQANLVTFYGSAVLTQFGDSFGVHPYTLEYFNKAVVATNPIGKVTPSLEWTDEVLNWFQKRDLERPRAMKKNYGFEWLKEGACEGRIIGGCITSILHLRGTKFWPDFDDSIFFWELPESSADISKGEPVSRIDAHLTDLKLSGVFEKVRGMIVGRPKGYSNEDTQALRDVILQLARDFSFPILFNVDIGHTDPIITVPLGVRCALDSALDLFEISESGVCDV